MRRRLPSFLEAALVVLALSACTDPPQIKGMPTATGTNTLTSYSPYGGGDATSSYLPASTKTVIGTGTATNFGGFGTSLPTGTSLATGTGATSGTATGTSTGTGLAFTGIVSAVDSDCGGAQCHGTGASNDVYSDNQQGWDNDKALIATKLNDGSMPPGGNIPAADKQLMLQYCNQ